MCDHFHRSRISPDAANIPRRSQRRKQNEIQKSHDRTRGSEGDREEVESLLREVRRQAHLNFAPFDCLHAAKTFLPLSF